MLYDIAHYLQYKVPFIWDIVEIGNAFLFKVRFYGKLSNTQDILTCYSGFSEVKENDIKKLVCFFDAQPEDAFEFFRPHSFDEKTLRKLHRRKSFLMYCVKDESGQIEGYFFLRCFFIGKAFLGKMVDFKAQGKGIGTQMCLCAMDIAQALGLRMFETISKNNIASLRSTEKVLDVRVIKEMGNGYLYLEDLGKKSE